MALFFLSNFYVVQMNEGLPVEHTQEELQDIQAEEEHSQPCSGRKGPSAGTAAAAAAAVASAAAEAAAGTAAAAAVASAAAEAAAEDMLLLLAAAVQ